jgi:P4 family phage/plasmid primase-like protien
MRANTAKQLGDKASSPDTSILRLFANLGPRWGHWRWLDKKRADGSTKRTKPPVQPTNKPTTWMSIEDALASADGTRHIALFLAPLPGSGEKIVTIDLDLCRSLDDGTIASWAKAIIDKVQTYTEISVSGTGVKLVGLAPPGSECIKREHKVEASIPAGSDIGAHTAPGYEVFVGQGYSATTFDHLPGTPRKLRTLEMSLVIELLNGLPPEMLSAPRATRTAAKGKPVATVGTASEYEVNAGAGIPLPHEPGEGLPADYADVLSHISSVDRAIWLRIGAALHYSTDGSDVGRYAWDAWSKGCPEKFHLADQKNTWRSFRTDRENPVTWGSVVHMARENGYVSPNASTSSELSDLTDLGNSERFLARHGKDILFCYHSRKWHAWDGRRWKQDNEGRVERLAKSVARDLKREAKSLWQKSMGDDKKEKAAKEAHKWAMKSQAKERLAAIPAVARSEVAVDVTDFDVEPWLVNFRNGTLDLRTGEMRAHAREDRITRLIDVAYDSNAAAPEFEKFLHTIMGEDTELIGFLRRAIGYSLSGDTSEQVLFMMHGDGSNGKSTLLEIVRAALSDYGRATDLDTFCEGTLTNPGAPSEGIARLAGARFVSAAESGEDQRLNERLIKMATGEDKLSARYLHQNSFEFTPAFKLWFALNHLPDIRGQDHAIWRRVRAIPFKVTIPENKKDKKLKSRIICNELPGVLAWIVRGFFEWQRDGLSPPAKVLAYTQAYREKVDVIAPFIDAKLVEDANGRIAGDDCLYLYQEYCADNGEIALHPNTFKKRMAARGFPGNQQWCPVKRAPVRFHVGVRAKTSDEIETQARSVEQDIEDSINSQQASLFH